MIFSQSEAPVLEAMKQHLQNRVFPSMFLVIREDAAQGN